MCSFLPHQIRLSTVDHLDLHTKRLLGTRRSDTQGHFDLRGRVKLPPLPVYPNGPSARSDVSFEQHSTRKRFTKADTYAVSDHGISDEGISAGPQWRDVIHMPCHATLLQHLL
jgi:hypothetical protein